METDYKKMTTDLLNTGMWDQGRLQFILECIEKNKPIYKTDRMYLESINKQLEDKMQQLQKNVVKTIESKKNNAKTLLSDDDINNIIDKEKSKTTHTRQKNKSFFARLFSRK